MGTLGLGASGHVCTSGAFSDSGLRRLSQRVYRPIWLLGISAQRDFSRDRFAGEVAGVLLCPLWASKNEPALETWRKRG